MTEDDSSILLAPYGIGSHGDRNIIQRKAGEIYRICNKRNFITRCIGGTKMEQEEMEGVTDKQVTVPEALLQFEGRITKLEVEQNKMFEKLDDIKTTMSTQNEEQKDLLNKLIEHHLSTRKLNLSSFWKWVISITGAGGLLTIVIVTAVNFFGQ